MHDSVTFFLVMVIYSSRVALRTNYETFVNRCSRFAILPVIYDHVDAADVTLLMYVFFWRGIR